MQLSPLVGLQSCNRGGAIVGDQPAYGVGRVEVLSEDQCLALLARRAVGRIVFVDAEGQPMALPVNYVLRDRTIAFRNDPGTKLAATTLGKVAFEIDGIDPLYHEGWSVVVKGVGQDITEGIDSWSEQIRSEHLLPWAAGERRHWIVISDPSFSGRRIRNSTGLVGHHRRDI